MQRLSTPLMHPPAAADEGLVTIFARPAAPSRRGVSTKAAICSAAVRRLVLAAGLLTACAAAALTQAPSAGAVVVSENVLTPVGLQPRIQARYGLEGAFENASLSPVNYLKGPEPGKYANPEGNPVVHGSNTWIIFWDPKEEFYHGDWQHLIETYMSNAATASGSLNTVFSLDAQYTDHSNQPATYRQVYRGGAEDTVPYPQSGCEDPQPLPPNLIKTGRVPPTTCLTSVQVANQLESFIKAHNLPTGMSNIYYLLTPPGVTVCLDSGGPSGHCSDYQWEGTGPVPWYIEETESYRNSFCSYHGDINPDGPSGGSGTILYGVIPWSAGTYKDPDYFPVYEKFGGSEVLVSTQYPGWECQDGGWESSKKGELYEKERTLSAKEKTEFEAKNEKEKAEELEAKTLEGPHEQEPNQQPCPTEDGGCDYGLADLIIDQISVEQQNIVTDPLLTSWKDPNGYEDTDECRFFFGPPLGGSGTANPETDAGTLYNQELNGGLYYLNNAFNLAGELLNFPGIACLHDTALAPEFTAPSPVNTGEIVAFNGMGSDITLNAGINYSPSGSPQANYATYTWNFGDGTPTVTGWAPGTPPCSEEGSRYVNPCAGSVFHSYEYGGSYEVTLSVRDVAGDIASVTHIVNVSGPSRPGSGSTGGAGSGSGAGATAHPGLPTPLAAAVIVPQSLRTALRKGLAVSYSVNEQVAGHFEVLLGRALARKLHISGTPATGLAAGVPPELVVAKAILVTTKGGRSVVHIDFSKRTAARLKHTRKLPLMLRLVVRNAAAVTATALASATLSG